MAVIGINYKDKSTYTEEGERLISGVKYKSVYLHFAFGRKKKFIFKTGNFVLDWYNLMKYYISDDTHKDSHLSHSSSVNHFIMDGANFDSAYLHMVNDKPVLYYIDRTKEDWWNTNTDDGIEFFVEAGTMPTWEELKNICNDVKK